MTRSLYAQLAEDEPPRQRALTALRLMRREYLSLNAAARRAGTTPRTVRRHLGTVLRKTADGRYRALPGDRLLRTLRVLTTEGEIDLKLRGSRVASLVAGHWAAIRYLLATGDERDLARFRGRKVAGHELETDPDQIERQAKRGELAFEDIYVNAV